MTVSIAVTLVCDNRPAPGCEWSYNLGADPDPAAVAVTRRTAAELGWTTLRDDGTEVHLCPACNGARLAVWAADAKRPRWIAGAAGRRPGRRTAPGVSAPVNPTRHPGPSGAFPALYQITER